MAAPMCAPISVREGGFIRDGYHEEVDRLRHIMNGGKGVLAEIEAKEKERTGIRTLKIGYNKVFGYYIEVSNSFKDQVPDTYIRKQTLVNGERYITQELKDLEHEILTASDRVVALEYELFTALRQEISAQIEDAPHMTLLIVIFLAPFVEEVLFRGLVFGNLRRKSAAVGYLVSCLLFALLHVWQFAVVNRDITYFLLMLQYLVPGLVLAWVYDRTGTLWTSIGLHAAANALSAWTLVA